jgi:hypothetical protein
MTTHSHSSHGLIDLQPTDEVYRCSVVGPNT